MKAPKWDGLRPTSDKLRETLFNIIAPHVMDARVLDVFAGTGAIALEALSRGAAAATCIEQDRRAVQLIEENRAICGEATRCTSRSWCMRWRISSPARQGLRTLPSSWMR